MYECLAQTWYKGTIRVDLVFGCVCSVVLSFLKVTPHRGWQEADIPRP